MSVPLHIAARLMGNHLVSPFYAIKKAGDRLPLGALVDWERVPFSEPELAAAAATQRILVAIAPLPLTHLHRVGNEVFSAAPQASWYLNEPFARVSPPRGWQMIRREPNRHDNPRLPVVVAVYAALVFYGMTAERLFATTPLYSADTALVGDRKQTVCVQFGEAGIEIFCTPEHRRRGGGAPR